MQGMMHKKDTSHITVCPRCGTENLTRQSHCGKCGYIFPKNEGDARKASGGQSSIPGAPRTGGAASVMGGAANPGRGGGGSGAMAIGGRGATSSQGAGAGGPAMPSNSSIPGAPKSVPVAPGAAVQAQEGADAPKIKSAHEKLEAHAEGLIRNRGEWAKCPRCEGDVKADSVRCAHCGWKMGKK